MNLDTLKKTIGALIVMVSLAACVDAPNEAQAPFAANNPLASSFDLLADEQLLANDVERSEDFRWAALSLRAGVTPTSLEVNNNGTREVYDSFVHAVTWATETQALRPPLHRSLVAWRRSGDVLQVMLIALATDSAPVLNPLSLRPSGSEPASPIAGAKAAYFERGPVNSTWVGVNGFATVAEHPQPSACPPPPNAESRTAGVTCQLTRFGVKLNVTFARTRSRDSRDVDPQAPTRGLIAPAQTVAGVKLVFTCSMPMSTGC